MTISFDDIPAAPEAAFLRRTRPPLPNRRLVLRTVAGAATAVAFGALETVNAAVAKAAYFQEYTQHPRRAVRARRLRRQERRQGPQVRSLAALPDCCWTLRAPGSIASGGTAPAPSAARSTPSGRTSAGPAPTRRGAGSSRTATPTAARTATGSPAAARPRPSAPGRCEDQMLAVRRPCGARSRRRCSRSACCRAHAALLRGGFEAAALCSAAAVAGVALSGST